MKKKIMMLNVTMAMLLTLTTAFGAEVGDCIAYGIKWGSESGLQGVYQVAGAPGCTVNGFCYWETWVNMTGGSVTSAVTGKPCTVYRNGVPVLTVNAYNNPQAFADLDVVPGETYTYTVGGYMGGMTSPINVTCVFIYTAELSTYELCFAANDDSATKKTVTPTLYKQTADAKVAISLVGSSYTSSHNWIQMELAANSQGINIWVKPNDTYSKREGTVTFSYNGYSWPIKITQAGKSADSYSSWAEANGLSGAWDAKDANGIYNVFRYAFGIPAGKSSETPLMDIAVADGKPTIKTPAVVNTSGFALSIEASDKADGTGNTASYPLNANGETVIEEGVKPSRFFRLKAVQQ